MIDIHAHLCFPDFDHDRGRIISECNRELKAVIVSSARYDEALCALKVASQNEKIFPSIGYHPTEGGSNPNDIIELIRLNADKIVAVGEVGLDYHWENDIEKRENQKDIFFKFIGLATELEKPLVIHSWDAERECFDLLEKFENDVIYHCYSGPRELAQSIVNRGSYISFSTQILFSKNHKKLAKDTPLDQMLLETDSPFLSPFKKMRNGNVSGVSLPGFDPEKNYPWNILLSARKIAKVKNVTIEEVLTKTTQNAKNVFRLRI